ncbi:MAG: haloacid dehalogenase type II [Rhodospirillales bacterium]|nr:haloacid dehalogenase type II [Rhodospirillales bacterium]
MQAKLVTYDVYMALLDIEGSLVPAVTETLDLNNEAAAVFVRLWRGKQMERAAASNSLEKPRTPFRDCTFMALDYCLGRYDISIPSETRKTLVLAWDTMNPWPEAEAAIAAVKDKGLKTAILSNGDQDMLEAVARNFTPQTFDYILSSETAGYYKPHPAVYDLPTEVLGISKDEIVHVAGSPNDVTGAVAAGMRCIWSNRHGDQVLDPNYPPTVEITDLSGVANLIELQTVSSS